MHAFHIPPKHHGRLNTLGTALPCFFWRPYVFAVACLLRFRRCCGRRMCAFQRSWNRFQCRRIQIPARLQNRLGYQFPSGRLQAGWPGVLHLGAHQHRLQLHHPQQLAQVGHLVRPAPHHFQLHHRVHGLLRSGCHGCVHLVH